MARKTQAQQIEFDNEQAALDFFKNALGALPDHRRPQGKRYPLQSVIVIALMAMVCGCDDAEAMQAWGEANQQWLSTFLDLPHGPPTQDVFLSVFSGLDPDAFAKVFRGWASLLTLRLKGQGKHIAVDGKTSRRSADKAAGKLALHTVSAWASEAGLVLGQCKTEQKSNEITAIPELLALLDLRNTTVTIDAMGCQTAIAQTIRDGEGHYLLGVKDNQPTLHQDAAITFAEAADDRMRAIDEAQRPEEEVFEEVEKGHGRIETRSVAICRDLTWMTTQEKWADLNFIAQVTRVRETLATEKTSVEVSYYIGSDPEATAESAAATIRRHWGIENQLHWVLDMAFREDEARHRARNTAHNFTILRHFALNLIKQESRRKLGVANSRKRAGWDRAYLLELMAGVNASTASR